MNNNNIHTKYVVGLVQINNSFSGQNYLPLSIGMLQAYAQKNLKQPDDFVFQSQIYKRISVETAVNHLKGTNVIFFSTYVWNWRISLAIGKAIKSESPSTIIVFGGPQVPDNVEPFLREHPYVDLACHGEGEQLSLIHI